MPYFLFYLWVPEKWGKAISLLKHQVCVLPLDYLNVFALFSGLDLFCVQFLNVKRLQQRERCILLKSVFSAFSAFFRLRALSSGGSVTSPPLSPALPKYKLADYRYGREEMLALFVKDNKVSRKRKKAWCVYVRSLVIRDSCLYYMFTDTNSYPLAENLRDLSAHLIPLLIH